MDYAETLSELNITLGDSSDVTFTPEEKARALQKAWNDPYVVKIVWDSSLTFDSNTFNYAVPATLTTVKDIYIKQGSSTFQEPIPSDSYELVNGYIQFNSSAQNFLTTGDVLYLKGNYKLAHASDTLDTVALQEYVIALAGVNTLKLLGYKKANLFLKNDTTMAEVIALKREFENDLVRARGALLKEFESA